jgi:hypothetical protein
VLHSYFMSHEMFMTVANSLHPYYYVGHCPPEDVYLIYTTFRNLFLLPSSGDCCHYTDIYCIYNILWFMAMVVD